MIFLFNFLIFLCKKKEIKIENPLRFTKLKTIFMPIELNPDNFLPPSIKEESEGKTFFEYLKEKFCCLDPNTVKSINLQENIFEINEELNFYLQKIYTSLSENSEDSTEIIKSIFKNLSELVGEHLSHKDISVITDSFSKIMANKNPKEIFQTLIDFLKAVSDENVQIPHNKIIKSVRNMIRMENLARPKQSDVKNKTKFRPYYFS